MATAKPTTNSNLPPLAQDAALWGMTVTQFLGAFNDNLLKQTVLLLCIDLAPQFGGRDYQWLAQALFALPFVMFSGFAGFLADRYSKRRIVVSCKVAEIVIVLLAIAALSTNQLALILAVLFLMGTHSAFFGPSKFGILPELLRESDLPKANGLFLMTTFLAIIFGTASAGYLKGFLGGHAFVVGTAFLAIAVTGTLTSLLVRPTPVAHPGLKLRLSDLAIDRETMRMFLGDRPLLLALLMSSLFWFVGGIVQPSVNAFGKKQLFVDQPMGEADAHTSLMVACLGIGIAAGCGLAGQIAGKQGGFRLVTWGAWGIVIGLACLTGLAESRLPVDAIVWGSRAVLIEIGAAAGFFTVPLQVFLQSRPPADQKGRVIGAMNLVNWIGIFLSAAVYKALDVIWVASGLNGSTTFLATAALMLPVALFYRPGRQRMKSEG